MRAGGRTPEELETLLEDAFVTGERDAITALFMDGAVLSAGATPEARGDAEIDRLAMCMLDEARTYVAEPRRVLQAGDTALVVAERGINVVRRGGDGIWRYAIALLSLHPDPKEQA